MKTNNLRLLATFFAGGAVLLSQVTSRAQTLFSDDFQTDSSANWTIFALSGNGVTNDYTAQFAFDYSTQAYRYNGVTNHVPASPNSGGTTKGLKVTVNKNGNTSVAAMSLYPNGQTFSNNYSLKFDLWMDYSGDIPFGDGGSTEFASFGLNHTGTEVNWPNSPPNGDGVWFAVTADGGSGRDFRAFVGDSTPGPNVELTGSAGFLDRDADGTAEQNVPDAGFSPFQLMFPAPPGQTSGALGKQWSQVEVRQQNGIITWLVNGYIIAQNPVNNGFTSGNIMLGYMDPFFSELPDEPFENYAIFDNVRVVDLGTSDPPPIIDVAASDNDASEPGANTGRFTLTRTGSTLAPLTVNLRIGGTASNGVDYVTIPATITFASGASDTNIAVTPINDSIGEQVETVILSIVGNPSVYDVRNNFAIVNISDDNDVPTATVTAIRPSAYENNRAGRFNFVLSNPNSTDTSLHFSASGTAVNGVAYTNIGTTILIPAGQTNAVVTIQPLDNATRDGARNIVLALTSGAGYSIGSSSNATEILYDDDVVQGPAMFADDFETNSAPLWTINRSQSDGGATFGFDYSTIGIPPAPHSIGGTTFGLKLQANDTNAIASGISVSPVGKSFAGDYRLRFDLWINYNGPLFDGGSQSTEFASFGIGTKGIAPQWSGGGSGDDAVWASMDGDSGNGRDVRMWKAATEVTAASNPGVYPAASQNTANTPYYYFMGGDPAPAGQLALFPGDQTGTTGVGNPGFAWHDVMLTKIGSIVTWTIDGVKIAGVDVSTFSFSTNIFVGFYDPTAGISPIPDVAFALIDNLRVLTMQSPLITAIRVVGGNVQIDFTAAAVDTPGSFTLQSAGSVNGTYSDVSSTITSLGSGTFRATAPLSGPVQFYRIRR
jgi:hypothetical protein